MKNNQKKADANVRKPRNRGAKPNPKFAPRISAGAFDSVAYAAVLEVLG